MDADRAMAIVSVPVSAVSVIVAIWDREATAITASVFALFFAVVVLQYCSPKTYRWSFMSSLIVLICTMLAATFASYETLVADGHITRETWIYVSAVIRTVSVIPLISMFFLCTAAVSKASYNWVIVSSLTPFLGIGMMVPGYVLMNMIQRNDIDSGAVTNANIVIGLMVSLIIFLAYAFTLRYVFKRNQYMITEDGLERRS